MGNIVTSLAREFSVRFPFLEFDDLVQEGWQHLHTKDLEANFDPDKAKFTTWVYGIVYRCFLSYARKETRDHDKMVYMSRCHVKVRTPYEYMAAEDTVGLMRKCLSPLAEEFLECALGGEDIEGRWDRHGIKATKRTLKLLKQEVRLTARHVMAR